jgi:hypothetical protein
MSALSRAAIRFLYASSLVLSCACVPFVQAADSGSTTFKTPDGNKIIQIGHTSITIDGVAYPLSDCSDAANLCLSSPAVGFRASFPRKCSYLSWSPQGGAMKWSSGFPHSSGSRYINRSGSSFLYDWDQKQGLVSLVYDPTKNFAELRPSFISDGPTVYYRKSRRALLACR